MKKYMADLRNLLTSKSRINIFLFLGGVVFLLMGIMISIDYMNAYPAFLYPLKMVQLFHSSSAFKAVFLMFVVGAALLINSFVAKGRHSKNSNLFLLILMGFCLFLSFVYAPMKLDEIIHTVETKHFGIDENNTDRPTSKYFCTDLLSWKGDREFTLTLTPLNTIRHSDNQLLRSGIYSLNLSGVLRNPVLTYPLPSFVPAADMAIVFVISVVLLVGFIIKYSIETVGSTAQRLYRLVLLSFITYLLGNMVFEAERFGPLLPLVVLVGLFFFEEFGVFERFGIDREVYMTGFFLMFGVAYLFRPQSSSDYYDLGALFLFILFGTSRLSKWQWETDDKMAIILLSFVAVILLLLRQYVLFKFLTLFGFLLIGGMAILAKNLEKRQRGLALVYLLFLGYYLILAEPTMTENSPVGHIYRYFQTPLAEYTLLYFDRLPDEGGFVIFRGGNLAIVASNGTCSDCFWFKNGVGEFIYKNPYVLILKDVDADLSPCGVKGIVKYDGLMEIHFLKRVGKDPLGCVMAMQAKKEGNDAVAIGCLEER